MRIAQLSPLCESVPPRLYGGTERVVSYLAEELVAQGHDVTLFASGDSHTSGRLVACSERALRLSGRHHDVAEAHRTLVQRVLAVEREFDVIHVHFDRYEFGLSPLRFRTPTVTTAHGRLDVPSWQAACHERAMGFVSISNAQRLPRPTLNWLGTVYHGLPEAFFAACPREREVLAFVGRISPEKRVDRAIEVARQSGMRLMVAAKVDNADYEYYCGIKHLLREPWVDFIGEVDDTQKRELLARARALLFPIDWPEPFGLVMIEAMAAGTPVIAFRNGSTPEVIDEGDTGYVVDDIAGAARALGRLDGFDHGRCREVARRRFSARRMASDYLKIYAQLRETLMGTLVPLGSRRQESRYAGARK